MQGTSCPLPVAQGWVAGVGEMERLVLWFKVPLSAGRGEYQHKKMCFTVKTQKSLLLKPVSADNIVVFSYRIFKKSKVSRYAEFDPWARNVALPHPAVSDNASQDLSVVHLQQGEMLGRYQDKKLLLDPPDVAYRPCQIHQCCDGHTRPPAPP